MEYTWKLDDGRTKLFGGIPRTLNTQPTVSIKFPMRDYHIKINDDGTVPRTPIEPSDQSFVL